MVEARVEYCAFRHYTPRATGALVEVRMNHEFKIVSGVLIPEDSGKFEVTVGDQFVYSKLRTG